jgi:hypothetical protein
LPSAVIATMPKRCCTTPGPWPASLEPPLGEELDALARRARIDLDAADGGGRAPNTAMQRLELTPREIDVLAWSPTA